MIDIPETTDEGKFRIRVSSLPGAPDCFLRNAANSWPGLIASKGYTLRELPRHVGALVGGALHKGAELYLKMRMMYGELPHYADDAALADADEHWAAEVDKGHPTLWDDATPHVVDAHDQIRRMLRTYRAQVLGPLHPLSVESRLEANFDDEHVLSGQEDTFTLLPDTIRDLKGGRIHRNVSAQLGGYRLLRRAYQSSVKRLIEDWIPRTSMKKPQPPARTIEYAIDDAEKMAYGTATHITRQLTEFRATGYANAFPANPESMLCSDRYCRAWGTDLCSAWKGKAT